MRKPNEWSAASAKRVGEGSRFRTCGLLVPHAPPQGRFVADAATRGGTRQVTSQNPALHSEYCDTLLLPLLENRRAFGLSVSTVNQGTLPEKKGSQPLSAVCAGQPCCPGW